MISNQLLTDITFTMLLLNLIIIQLNQLKYSEAKLLDEQYELLKKIRDKLSKIICEQTRVYNIDIISYLE